MNQYLQHVAEYADIIGAVKGSVNDKKLASQFITRFFKHFPSLMDQAIEALFDLCEDEDVSVSFSSFCLKANTCGLVL